MVLDYPAGPMSPQLSLKVDQGGRRGGERQGERDAALLVLGMEEKARSQGRREPLEAGAGQEMEPPEGASPAHTVASAQ